MIIFGMLDHAKQIARAAGCGFDPDVNYVLSRIRQQVSGTLVLNDPELLGGVLYTDYTKRTVRAHIAGFAPRWLSLEFMWAIHDFPFNYLGVEKIFVTIPSTNEHSMKVAQQMGFSYVTTLPAAVLGGDMEVLSMSRNECRWLKLRKRYSAQRMEHAA